MIPHKKETNLIIKGFLLQIYIINDECNTKTGYLWIIKRKVIYIFVRQDEQAYKVASVKGINIK